MGVYPGRSRCALAEAKEINKRLAAGKGFAPRLRGSASGHTLADAVLIAVEHSGANELTRRDYLSRANAFLAYMERSFPSIKAWAAVTPEMVANYVESSRREGISHDTLRLRLYVLRMTARFMAATFPDEHRDVCAGVRLRRKDAPKSDGGAILEPGRLRDLLAYLREREPMIYVWATLQGCAGLRELEGAYLRERDFDATASTLAVAESTAHAPKNSASHRTIPVAPIVREALASWIDGLKVRDAGEGYLFTPTRARTAPASAKSREARAGAFTRHRIAHLWADALARARRDGVELPEAFTPRKLRASFVTAMRVAGADFAVLQRYIGHAPSSILAAHYDRIDQERMRPVASLAQSLAEGAGAFAETEIKSAKTGAQMQ
jgi:site-specific recombinase XerC